MTEERTMTELQAGTTERSVTKGLMAGLIGGLVAIAAKSAAERAFPSRIGRGPEVLATDSTGRSAAGSIPWGFGAGVGAVYGVVAEYFPAASDKDGASFGMALATLTHKGALPMVGLPEPITERISGLLSNPGSLPGSSQQTTGEKTVEMASHVLFGVIAETVRRLVRARI